MAEEVVVGGEGVVHLEADRGPSAFLREGGELSGVHGEGGVPHNVVFCEELGVGDFEDLLDPLPCNGDTGVGGFCDRDVGHPDAEGFFPIVVQEGDVESGLGRCDEGRDDVGTLFLQFANDQ